VLGEEGIVITTEVEHCSAKTLEIETNHGCYKEEDAGNEGGKGQCL